MEDHYQYRLEALHNYERILDIELENGNISGDEHEQALTGFQKWVELGSLAILSVEDDGE